MPRVAAIDAADGLRFALGEHGNGRIRWRESWIDALGPIGLRVETVAGAEAPAFTQARRSEGADDLGAFAALELSWSSAVAGALRTTVRAYRERPLLVFRLEAAAALHGVATGHFDRPSAAWPWCRPDLRRPDALPPDTRALAHAYTEFALPTQSAPDCAGFFLLPFRPAVVAPLWLVAPDGSALLLAPLDAFHEQVIGVPRGAAAAGDGLRCGWHGDLDEIPAGFATELALWAMHGPRAALERHAKVLRERAGTRRPGRYADALGAKLSYWTDNGAAYWYRNEPGCDGVVGTLEAAARSLREQEIPYEVFQLDSWFYPHAQLRPFDDPDVSVPPTGLLTWDARPDVLPEGLPALRRRLGNPPLAAHCRHFASASPYFETHAAWIDGDRAHPSDATLYERLLHQASSWGVETFEHDWLIECFLGVRGLRAVPGRARAWQEGLDRAAAAHGMTLQWCMASPADFFQTTTLERVTSIRTSGDYKYLIGAGALWTWFLHGNALARALGLFPFKDVFLSRRDGEGSRDGDPHAEVEALLAALSAGPVGIGDRVGRSDRALILRTCRSDGVIVRPDVPVAALDRCWRGHAALEPNPLVGEAHTVHEAGRWTYLVAMNAYRGEQTLSFALPLTDLGPLAPVQPVLAFDWRRRCAQRVEPEHAFELSLAPLDWDYLVLCPILSTELAVIGDVDRYATAGDRRLGRVMETPDGVSCDVLGAPEEQVHLVGWAAREPAAALRWDVGSGRAAVPLAWDAAGSLWSCVVAIGPSGWLRLEVAAG
ncbi:MAG: hypothetical protein M5U32_06650 [Myxococcota bacterium]|nr:hypothetical protein [Myxococcota bacterium]